MIYLSYLIVLSYEKEKKNKIGKMVLWEETSEKEEEEGRETGRVISIEIVELTVDI